MTKPETKKSASATLEDLEARNAELDARLREAEETIHAIQKGAVDAFVLEEANSHRVYTLEGADRPYRIFVEEMQQGVATLHADGTIVYCNRRLPELLNMPPEKLMGSRLLDFVVAEDRPIYDGLLRRTQAGSGRGEARLQRAGGGLIPAYLTFSELPPDCGAMIGVLVTDLTSQKHHEQLALAQQALREADRRKNEFLAMLAHELRNPLAPIRNSISILRQRGGEPVQETCEMLERQVSLMVRLVDDLVDVSRITRNKIELRKERVELAAVVEQALECIRPVCASLGHEVTIHLPEEPVVLEGDPIRLTQVFANLLDNSCKYMERGGRITLSAELAPPRGDTAGEVAVRVRDQGIGIAPDQLSRIFDMFAQVDTSLERAKSGLGIGLTLVKSLVELHGGAVEAHSEGPGRGCEFVVRLPVPGAPVARRLAPAAAAPETRSYRILVADDNRDSAQSLALLLKLMGHETHTAMDGVEAVEAAQTLHPDIVLLDIGMPRLNGYDACRRIREQPWSRSMTLIAQTGWGQEEDRRRTEEAGFDGHLIKPVDPDVLLKLVATLSTSTEN
ncbi:MAG TPA: ATP-binding protein [Candidatus Polarisedimenticolia bacterium]|nr:ATP-binding protein [Candidatus Polarisedimenticolia bacterium]